ncbi:kinase-like protein [Durotheca rogersii]|uniref:kinase-like protein n=1 Tax=Durotheca rogersii TaxID=419775 RepID=UPI00221F0252|nr:kinase-like protein [Durotheca rogersii]KAI5864307.1 kinase-like protein [Durotheca rogersii]
MAQAEGYLEPPRWPRNFEEMYRARNWRFHKYRTEGLGPAYNNDYLALNRTAWLAHPFPGRQTMLVPVDQPILQPPLKPYLPRLPGANILDAPQPDDNPKMSRARERLRQTKNTFDTRGPFIFVRPLGYGGLGLTAQFKQKSQHPGVPDRDIVVKVALRGWEDSDIRGEEKMTKKVARAAHCIQRIDPTELNVIPNKPFEFEPPDLLDSSSEEGESSGEESREDEPVDKPPIKRRRWRLRNDAAAMNEKHKKWRERTATRKKKIMDRSLRIHQIHHLRATGLPNLSFPSDLDVLRMDYLLLEFMENGDVAHLIYKINDLGEKVPNRVLWSFWSCLVKACVAMEYPPRKFHPRRRKKPEQSGSMEGEMAHAGTILGQPNWKVLGNDLFEDLPPLTRRWAGKRKSLVHFDIDPRNIFVGGFDVGAGDGEHELVPRLKIADFGCSKEIKPDKGNYYYLAFRQVGKEGFFAPEQFGLEWEFVAPKDGSGPEISEQAVAGNYGSPMNVWGIAQTMWMMITGFYPPSPPEPHQDGPFTSVSYCSLLMTDEKYASVDLELRRTIAACMRHNPHDRPSLQILMQQARSGVAKSYPDESDTFIRNWVKKMFTDAS